MRRSELLFERPAQSVATAPPEMRGLERDEVRLLVSGAFGHEHARFRDLPLFLPRGALLVVNRSATLPASRGRASGSVSRKSPTSSLSSGGMQSGCAATSRSHT